jgi:hypothetical protein
MSRTSPDGRATPPTDEQIRHYAETRLEVIEGIITRVHASVPPTT